jgi:hypothetical protein
VNVGTTYLHPLASLDGYIADENDEVGPLHEWYFAGDHPLVDEDPLRVARGSAVRTAVRERVPPSVGA